MQLRDDSGEYVDAHFSVEGSGDSLCVVVEARGGTRGTPGARNVDYTRGLELLLSRLRACGACIDDAMVDSRTTQGLSPDASRIHLGVDYPVEIGDPAAITRRLSAAQAEVGRAPDAKGAGNRTRRIRLFLGFEGKPPEAQELETTLARPIHQTP